MKTGFNKTCALLPFGSIETNPQFLSTACDEKPLDTEYKQLNCLLNKDYNSSNPYKLQRNSHESGHIWDPNFITISIPYNSREKLIWITNTRAIDHFKASNSVRIKSLKNVITTEMSNTDNLKLMDTNLNANTINTHVLKAFLHL